MREREIIHVDITAFAVAVERIVRPELRGRPVVVAPVGTARSVVMDLSREAWEAGVRRGMVLSRAVRYCRGVTVLPLNEPLYGRASRAVWDTVRLLAGAGAGGSWPRLPGCHGQ